MSTQGYTSPGVQVLETINSTQASLASNPSLVAIVGAARGYQSATERDRLVTGTPFLLNNNGINTSTVTVLSSYTNATLNPGTYTIATSQNPITASAPYTITLTPAPATAPTLAAGTGSLVGTYVYAVSFLNSLGETGLGPTSAQIVAATTGVTLSAIPVDATVGNTTTGRNIYRAKVVAGVQGTFTLVATLANNTATTLTNESMSDSTAALAAVSKEGITSGETVIISYQYTDQYYFQPTEFTDYNSIVNKYGAPFDSSGNIFSQLTLAALVAFKNGARDIVTVAAVSSGDTDISTALQTLATQTNVRIISCVSGSASTASALVAFTTAQNTQGFFCQGVAGFDGSSTAVTEATLQAAAQAYNYEALALVSPATFYMANPVTGNNFKVGGQYMAAAILGMAAARDVQIALTRKTVAGFVDVADVRTPAQEALDSQAGLMVIRSRGGVLDIRHQTTTAVSNPNKAEFSVVRAKYEMAHRLTGALDAAVVGQTLPVQQVPTIVNSVISGILESLQLEGAISLWGFVTSQISPTDATLVNASFQYYPVFPVNNIIVTFAIDTNTGDFTSNIGTG